MNNAAQAGQLDRRILPSANRSIAGFRVRVRSAELRRRMLVLGLSGVELARRAKVAEGTISHALNGRAIQPATLRAIASALAQLEPVPGADGLIDHDGSDITNEANDG